MDCTWVAGHDLFAFILLMVDVLLTVQQVNTLAGSSNLAGGHVRNAVFAAAVHSREREDLIRWDDILRGLSLEYEKLGRTLPGALRRPA